MGMGQNQVSLLKSGFIKFIAFKGERVQRVM